MATAAATTSLADISAMSLSAGKLTPGGDMWTNDGSWKTVTAIA